MGGRTHGVTGHQLVDRWTFAAEYVAVFESHATRLVFALRPMQVKRIDQDPFRSARSSQPDFLSSREPCW
jgi:hypothetical protein